MKEKTRIEPEPEGSISLFNQETVVHECNKNRVICYFLASRRFHFLVTDLNPEKSPVRFTQLRWIIIFAGNAPDLLTEILKYNGITRTFELMMAVTSSQASDPHAGRERFRSGWWA
jgi:hypothetical protein